MRAFLFILLVAASLHAQSLADAARRERARRAQLKPVQVIQAEGVPPAPAATKTEEAKKPAEQPKTAVDPVKEYNDQLQKLRAKVQNLMDDEAATLLQINDLTNQVNAPVVDQASKDQAVARLGDARQKLSAVRLELDQTRKAFEAMQAVGAPQPLRIQTPPQAQGAAPQAQGTPQAQGSPQAPGSPPTQGAPQALPQK